MKAYTVLFRDLGSAYNPDEPSVFLCKAKDSEDAQEQCTDTYPNCDIVHVTTNPPSIAYREYWGQEI